MSMTMEGARYADIFGIEQHSGLELEDERHGVDPRMGDYTALRMEQRCRDYWRRAYGVQAELASRGGVAWLWR